jgi:hypothetical protein
MDPGEHTGAGKGPPRTDPPAAERILMVEGWMFLLVLFPGAMAEIARVPPANDPR